ncbi:CCR4-NOT transcription complex subunit 10 [Culicoides brevitarsis]|uniref:CCR4-NOT transcription complex subunit 10 n=1 Tax=Culicoides brevitarsis TaxID=469753 RepID=UPI00307C32D0
MASGDEKSESSKEESVMNKSVSEYFKNDFKQFRRVINEITGLDERGYDNIGEILDLPAYYNHALLLFHERNYQNALKVIKAVLLDIDKLDEKLLQKAGLLGVNLYLETNNFKAADDLLSILNVKFGGICKEILNVDVDDEDVYSENSSEKLDVEKPDNPMEDFRRVFRLTMNRSNMLNGKIVVIPNRETAEYCILKAHKYYLGHDYQMAAKEMAKTFKNEPITMLKQGEDQNVCIANNMGLIHFNVRHFALAARFFQNSLKFDQAGCDEVAKSLKNQLPLYCVGATKRTEILYNLGLSLLHLERPKHAFECFLVPLQSYQNNPRLWLRLAESCIMVHRQALKEKEPKHIVSEVIGSGAHRKYILSPAISKYIPNAHQSFAIPSPTIEFANLCLRNAQTLIEHHSNVLKSMKKQPETIDEGIPCDPSRPLTLEAFEKLKIAVLSAYSYVLLSIGDYIMALKYAKELLNLENVPESYVVLGHLYAAEALIMMNKPAEACMYLEPKFIKDLKGDDFETKNWGVKSLEAAQSILTYNLAATLAIQGELNLSNKIASACKHPIVFPRLKILKMYLELQSGNIDNCKHMIRLDTPQYY